jgi:stalled ribosome rescue protein Dom34
VELIGKGLNEGIEKGLYQSIQINLKTRFHIKDESILKRIQQVRDIQKLEQILVLSLQEDINRI